MANKCVPVKMLLRCTFEETKIYLNRYENYLLRKRYIVLIYCCLADIKSFLNLNATKITLGSLMNDDIVS